MTSRMRIGGEPASNYLTAEKLSELGNDVYALTINFTVYTWGMNAYSVNTRDKTMTVGRFLDYYYGYVAVNK